MCVPVLAMERAVYSQVSLTLIVVFFLALQSPTMTTTRALGVIRIATRPSPLALKQAQTVADALQEAHPTLSTEFNVLNSSSEHKATVDRATQDMPLALTPNVDFTGLIDNAIINGEADIGVHSLKGIPPDHKWCTELLTIACYLPRACPLDVLIGGNSIETLPRGARVGSASTRRQSQLLSIRPDLKLVNLRGNVQTRLQHLEDGIVDALVMARAGLYRLGIHSDSAMTVLGAKEIMPGPGQGIVGVVCRNNDLDTVQLLQSLNDENARIAAIAERQVLNTVDANLVKPFPGRPPLAAFMEMRQDETWVLRARLLRPDGMEVLQVERNVSRQCICDDEARALGQDAANELVQRAGKHFME